MILLIDANIILDVLMNRQEFVKDSSMIWKLCETNQMKGYVSSLTFANMMYIMRKELTPEKIDEVFRKLKLIFEFADFNSTVLEKAVNMKWTDFEDAVQSAIAEQIDADYIITRNVRDFTKSKVIAFTPTELLARIQQAYAYYRMMYPLQAVVLYKIYESKKMLSKFKFDSIFFKVMQKVSKYVAYLVDMDYNIHIKTNGR